MMSALAVPVFAAVGGAASAAAASTWRESIDLGLCQQTVDGDAVPRLRNFINNDFVDPIDGAYIDDINPATGAPLVRVPRSGAKDLDAAVAAAKAAFPEWAKTPVAVRAGFLDKIADAIEAWAPELSRMEAEDSGKSLKMATNIDIPRSISNLRFFAGQIRHDETPAHMMHDAINYATREPIGVAGLISPWNLPLYLLSWKIAPALACGNTVVAKPSEITPRTAAALSAIVKAVGLPPGVLNIVHGLGAEAGQALVAHPDVPLVSFTGGTSTGKIVAATAAPLFKKISLELGGKNATVVFGDVDIDSVVAGAVRSAFTNNGQVCLAGSRLFVHKSIYEPFLEKFVASVERLKCGDPMSTDTDVGPVSSAVHRDKIKYYVDISREAGGRILCGGNAPADLPAALAGGFFIKPCVIAGLPPTCRASTEEIFGPVVTVHAFETEDEVVEAVNGVRYGLAGSIWTKDVTTAHRVARRIKSGILWVNCWLHRDLRTPFGGVKDSGLGREGGKFSLDFYSEWKNVCVFMGAP